MLNEKKLTQDIDKKGYTLIKGFFDKKKLNNIKNSLLDILNYISYSKEKDLQKKYYEIKKLNPKLKSNFYDLAPYNIDMQKGIHTPQLISFVKRLLSGLQILCQLLLLYSLHIHWPMVNQFYNKRINSITYILKRGWLL